jgi:hypothetical protein
MTNILYAKIYHRKNRVWYWSDGLTGTYDRKEWGYGGHYINGNWGEGKYYGKKATFYNWNINEPNNFWKRGEDCVVMKKNGKWNDAECKEKHRFICKSDIKHFK